MPDQRLSDIQHTIDRLFTRLDQAKGGGDLTQCTHALRVQITKKMRQKAALSEREAAIITALGPIATRGGGCGWWIAILALLGAAAAYLAYRHLTGRA